MAAQAGTLQFMALPEKDWVRYLKLTHGPQISVLDKRKPTLSIRSLFAHGFFLVGFSVKCRYVYTVEPCGRISTNCGKFHLLWDRDKYIYPAI